MPFIGNQPALSYTSFAKQDFTTSATTSYTLSQPVANENEIALFINFVRQEPTTAYTASGTTLTLTSATSATDDMYCVFLGKAVQTVNPPAGSVGTSQLADASVTSAKLASGVGGVAGITSSSTSGTALNITASNNLEISAGKNLTFSSSTAPLVNIDNATVTVTLTNGSSIDYVANSGFYGFCDHVVSGQTAICVAGGGSTAVFRAFTTYSNTSGSGQIRFFYNAGTSSYRLQNNIGSTITISCFNIKLR